MMLSISRHHLIHFGKSALNSFLVSEGIDAIFKLVVQEETERVHGN